MLLNTEKLQEVCTKILPAVEASELTTITDTLQLKTIDNVLHLSVTNKEYFVDVKVKVGDSTEFNATVNASLFLKLISQVTAKEIELTVKDNYLNVKANGNYKLPLIFEGNALLELPTIDILNPIKEFDVSSDILNSILNFNAKELDKGVVSVPIQNLFYIDENGAITFNTGACVNSFTLPQPIKILINKRLVKLFKLFKDCSVHFTLAYDAVDGSDELIQTKVKFVTDDIAITSILSSDESLTEQIPVSAIRKRAYDTYPHSVVVSKDELIGCINRLSIFSGKDKSRAIHFAFNPESVEVSDMAKENRETIKYQNKNSGITKSYEAYLNMLDLKLTLDTCTEPSVTLSFGDNTAFVISRGQIKNVLPESVV